MTLLPILALSWILWASPAQAEPVSTVIGLTALIAGATGASAAVAGAIGGAFITLATSFALSAAQSVLSRTQTDKGSTGSTSSAQGINAPDVKGNIRSSVAPQRVIYGRAQVGGVLFFQEFPAPLNVLGALICKGPVSGVGKIKIGTNVVAFGDDNLALSAPYKLSTGQVRLGFSFRRGDDDQAIDPRLALIFPSLDPEFRQRGIATAVFDCHYGADGDEFEALWGQGGDVNPQIEIFGMAVYDPRDPSQDRDDESAWRWTDNATLIEVDYLRRTWGGRIRADRIDWDSVIDSADYDDELVGLKGGGFIKRHTINGSITLGQKPNEVLSGMLTANRASFVQSNGMVRVVSSRPRDPVRTIHDGLIVGAISFRASKPKREMYNRVRVRFVAPDREYQIADGPILDRPDLQMLDGELLEGTIQLPFTEDHQRGQRLVKQYLDESRLGKALTLPVKLELLGLDAGDVVRFDSRVAPRANGLYSVVRADLGEGLSRVELQLAEYDPAIARDWNPDDDEQDFALADLDLEAA